MKLLDTSVLVDIDRGGIGRRVQKLDDHGRHVISAVSVTELRLGVEHAHERGTDQYQEAVDGLDRLLARFQIEPVSRAVASAAAKIVAELRTAGKSLNDLHDVYVGATARTEQIAVLTANVGDFERIDEIRVIDWNEF